MTFLCDCIALRCVFASHVNDLQYLDTAEYSILSDVPPEKVEC